MLSKTITKRITTFVTAFVLAVSGLSGVIAPLFASVAFAMPVNNPAPWCAPENTYTFTKGGFSWSNPTSNHQGDSTTWSGAQGQSPVVVTTTGAGTPDSIKVNDTTPVYVTYNHVKGNDHDNGWHWVWQYKDIHNNWVTVDDSSVYDIHYTYDHGHDVSGGTGSYDLVTGSHYNTVTPTQPTGPNGNWNINVASGYNYLGLQTDYGHDYYSSNAPYSTAVSNNQHGAYLNSIKVCAAPVHVEPTQLIAPTISCVDTVNIPNFTQTWTKVTGASGYAYTTTYNGGATYSDSSLSHDSSIVYDLSGPTYVTRTNNTGTPLATYVWQVKSLGDGVNTSDSEWSAPCTTTYALPNQAPSVPQLLSPQTVAYRQSGNNNYSTWEPSVDPDGDSVTYRYQSSFSNATNPDGSFQAVAYDTNNSGGNLTATQIQNGGPNGLEPEGIYYWHVEAIDNKGLASGWSTTWEIVVDNTAPSVPVNGQPNNVILNSNVFNYTWDASTDNLSPVHYEYLASKYSTTIGGVLVNNVWSPAIGSDQEAALMAGPSIPSEGTSDGTWYWQVRAVDAAGNTSAWSQVWHYTLDTVAPKVTVSNLVTSNTTPTVTGTVDDPAATIVVTVDGHDYNAVNNGDGTWSADITNALALDTYDVLATATDLAGNSGHDTTTGELTIFAIPVPPVQPVQLLLGPTTSPLFTPTPRNTGNTGPTDNGNTNTDQAVEGAQTQANNSNQNNKDQAVEGASTTKGPWSLWGVAWYWWLIILAVLAAIIWWLIAGYRRRSDDEA